MNEESLLSTNDVALWLGVPIKSVQRWRYTGAGGPPSMKVGRHVRYRKIDIERWLDAKLVESAPTGQ
jgi:predicted DNA-binding transcriptional regulator AlpA